MKILFIGSYPNPVNPYMSIFFFFFFYKIADLGVECHVLSPVSRTKYRDNLYRIPEFMTEYTERGSIVKVYHPRTWSFSAKKIGNWNTMFFTEKYAEYKAVREYKKMGIDFDCVYGHFFLGGGLVAAKIAQRYSIPAFIAYGECNFESEISSKYRIHNNYMEGVKGIIAVSSKNKKDLENRSFAKDIPVLLSINAINQDEFYKKNKAECRKKLGLPEKDFIVGFVGYFIERKGSDRLLEACRGLPGVSLAFAGSGKNAPSGSNVVFCKSLPHEDVSDFLNAIDVFVLPTRNEGCSNAIIEAMACGNAIVSSNLSFNLDILNNSNSILINPNNIEEIRRAVIELRDNMEKRIQLSKQVLEDAEKLSLDNRAKNILNFIESNI